MKLAETWSMKLKTICCYLKNVHWCKVLGPDRVNPHAVAKCYSLLVVGVLVMQLPGEFFDSIFFFFISFNRPVWIIKLYLSLFHFQCRTFRSPNEWMENGCANVETPMWRWCSSSLRSALCGWWSRWSKLFEQYRTIRSSNESMVLWCGSNDFVSYQCRCSCFRWVVTATKKKKNWESFEFKTSSCAQKISYTLSVVRMVYNAWIMWSVTIQRKTNGPKWPQWQLDD